MIQLTKAINLRESYYKDSRNKKDNDAMQNIEPIDLDNKIQLVAEINTNVERLEQKRKDLENIKLTSAKLNTLSSQLKTDIYRQGEILNSIEDNIIQVHDDVDNAADEIRKAEELSRKARKKIIWIAVIIAFIAISVAILGYLIYSNTKS